MKKLSNILIVEDEPDLARTLVELLTHYGYTAEVATAGLEALEIARESAFDLIILDVELPDFNGFRVYLALRELHISRTTPVIFTSGTPSHEYVTRSRNLGGVDFIPKPFRAVELVNMIIRHSQNGAADHQTVR